MVLQHVNLGSSLEIVQLHLLREAQSPSYNISVGNYTAPQDYRWIARVYMHD